MPKYVETESYTPGLLFDELIDYLKVRNDARLAKALGVGAPVICKIRKKTSALSGDLILRIYDLTGINVDRLREMAGIPKTDRLIVKPCAVVEKVDAEEVG